MPKHHFYHSHFLLLNKRQWAGPGHWKTLEMNHESPEILSVLIEGSHFLVFVCHSLCLHCVFNATVIITSTSIDGVWKSMSDG